MNSYKYFSNKDCEYYPCHDLNEINCLFCFCPLYSYECGGNFKILDNGKKDCSKCNIPHKANGYKCITNKLKGDKMKVLSIRGNKVNFDFSQEEYDILLRDGLQKWIDAKIGPNKVKVVPPSLQLIPDKKAKPLTKKQLKEEEDFCNELLTLSVVAALKEGIERDSMFCDHANEVPSKCKCEEGCYCKSHTCKK